MRAMSRVLATIALWLAVGATPAGALGLIRDAEIEATLERMAHPIFRAAGLNPALVRIYIVDDPRAERLRRRRAEPFPAHRAHHPARDRGPAAGGDRARGRPHRRRAPGAARPGDEGPARRGGDRHARRRGGGGGGQPRGRPRHRHRQRQRRGAHRPGAQPRRGGERRPDGHALPGRGRRRPRRDARGAAPLPRPGRAAQPRRQQLRPVAPALGRAHRAHRGARRRACRRAKGPRRRTSTGTPAWWRRSTASWSRPSQTLRDYPAGDGSRGGGAGAGGRATTASPTRPRGGRGRRADRARGPRTPTTTSSRASSCSRPGDAAAAVAAYRQAVALAPREAADPRRARAGAAQHRRRRATPSRRATRSPAPPSSTGPMPAVLRDLALAEARLGNDGAAGARDRRALRARGRLRRRRPQRRARRAAPAEGLAGLAAGAGRDQPSPAAR